MLADVFTHDAVFEAVVADGEPMEQVCGREAIVAWLRGHMAVQSDQRRHNVQNPVVLFGRARTRPSSRPTCSSPPRRTAMSGS